MDQNRKSTHVNSTQQHHLFTINTKNHISPF